MTKKEYEKEVRGVDLVMAKEQLAKAILENELLRGEIVARHVSESEEKDACTTYPVNTRCDNCGNYQDVKIPRGTKTGEFFDKAVCPSCGCSMWPKPKTQEKEGRRHDVVYLVDTEAALKVRKCTLAEVRERVGMKAGTIDESTENVIGYKCKVNLTDVIDILDELEAKCQ